MSAALPQLPRPFIKPETIVRLRQDDFRNGPVVIDQSDVRVLFETDVVFSFPPPTELKDPFHLGFFAGLIIGAPRVVVDLQGHRLTMHPSFRMEQRFFAFIECDVTPFPVGKANFQTPPKSPTDITIRNGTMEFTSHFCIHASTCGGRILIEDLRMNDFEVGAVSLSGGSDIFVRRCSIGSALPPTTTSDFNMLRDLSRVARRHGAPAEEKQLMAIALQREITITSSDAICRSIVVMPSFNVNGIPDSFDKTIERVAVVDTSFEPIRAEPIELIGISLREGSDEALKDTNGNLISYQDALSGDYVSRMQASYSPKLPSHARRALMSGPTNMFYPVYGQDRRGHSLIGKASLFCRIDGCRGVTLHRLRAAEVVTRGEQGASVGIMLNGCSNISFLHVSVGGVQVLDLCNDALSDTRPRAGVVMRRCEHIKIDDYTYRSDASCGFTMRESQNASLTRCTMGAPSTFHKCAHVRLT